MSDRLVERLAAVELAAHIRHARLEGDPSRDPGETTQEDIVEALLRAKVPLNELPKRQEEDTALLRLMIKSVRKYYRSVDLQG